MSLTLAALVSEIYPKYKILLVEKLDRCGYESSFGTNNAGTGHAGPIFASGPSLHCLLQ